MTIKINDYKSYIAEVISNKILATDTFEITFSNPNKIEFLPGQFVAIFVDDGGTPCFRAYSLLEKNGNLQIVVKKVSNGRGSNFLFNTKKGDKLKVMLPMGYFTFPEKFSSCPKPRHRNLCFIATGTGLVPILSLLENVPNAEKTDVKILFGVRNEKDFFYLDRIDQAGKKFAKFSRIFTLSQPEKNWKGDKGRVTIHLEKMSFETDTQFFICGSGAMLDSVRQILKNKGVNKQNIFFENFNG